MDIRTLTLKNGFEITLDITTVENMRFLKLMANVDDDPLNFPRLIGMLLGDEQEDKLYSHLEANGVAPNVEALGEILTEILEGIGELKNS